MTRPACFEQDIRYTPKEILKRAEENNEGSIRHYVWQIFSSNNENKNYYK